MRSGSWSWLVALALSPRVGLAQSSVEEFRLGGSAARLNEHCVRLTPDAPYTSGSAWFERPVDLDRPFEVRVSLVLGAKDLQGADGIVFVLHPALRTGRAGEGMGFSGMVPSLGVEFDTYRNLHLDDPAADHVAFMENGARFHEQGRAVELPNLEDGARHPLRVRWDPRSGLEVVLHGKKLAAYPAERVRRIFGDGSRVFWGLTAGTGRLSNDQDVCIEPLLLTLDAPSTAAERGPRREPSAGWAS